MRAPTHLTALLAILGAGCLAQSGGTGTNTGRVTGGQTNGGGTTGGILVSSLVVLPSSLDFGQVPIGETAVKSVTLINQSTAEIDGITIAVSGPDQSLFTVLDAPSSLPAQGQATVDIRYAPLALETRSVATVTFGTGGRAVLSLSGEPAGTALTASPNPIDFGFVAVGTTAIGCATVSNQNSAAVFVSGVSDFDDEGGAFALSQVDDSTPPNPAPIPVTIEAGASAKVCFSFTPPITQQYTGEATLDTDDPTGTGLEIQLTGWGGGPQITCTPMNIAFGQTLDHSVSTIPIICTNTGTAVLGQSLVISLEIVGPGASDYSAQIDSSSWDLDAGLVGLAPGQSFQIDVSFTSTDGGVGPATLIVEINGQQKVQISLDGQGLDVPPCQFVVLPATLDFANVEVGDTSPPLSFEIDNVGTDVCSVEDVSIKDDPTSAFHILSTSIAPDPTTQRITIPAPAIGVISSLTVALDFAPTTPGQAFSAEAAFEISDPSDPNQLVPLSGSSQSTCLVVAPTALDFGAVPAGDAGTAQSFTVSNQCQATASVASITLQSSSGDAVPQYSALAGPALPASISPQSSLAYELSCEPTTSGDHSAQLVVSDGLVGTIVSLTCSAP